MYIYVYIFIFIQAICAKCSKSLDNKTSRVCPECFDASVSLEGFLACGDQKRKAATEVISDPVSFHVIAEPVVETTQSLGKKQETGGTDLFPVSLRRYRT